MITPLLLLVGTALLAMFIGMPVLLAVALSTVVHALVYPVMPPVVLVQNLVSGLDRGGLEAIPYFVLLGAIMNAGGLSARLVRLARALLGHRRGGLSQVNIGASLLFGGISGSAVADVSAIGSLMIPAMRRDGYPPAWCAALTASSASIGLLVPPSIPLVLFGLFNGVPVSELFLAGIVPGTLMGLYLMLTTAWIAGRRGFPRHPRAGRRELLAAFTASAPVLLLPVLIVLCLYRGVATASETGALSVIYAALLVVVMRDDRAPLLRTLPRAIAGAALDSARVLSIVAVAGGTIWIVANLGATEALAARVAGWHLSPTALLGAVAVLLVLLGTVVGPGLQMILIIPALTPVAVAAGIDVVHFGIVTVLSSALGLVTPPIGILLFLTAAQAKVGIAAVVREALPLLGAMVLLLATLVLVPGLSIGLVSLVRP